MELTVKATPISCLRCVLREVRRQEETSEAIVPDTCPDIGSVLDAFAAPVLRGKDLRSGSVTISGGIKGGVLYLPEDGSHPRCLEYYVPFTVKLEDPALTEQSRVVCDLRITSVDGRMIHSRKALLRTSLCCAVTVYEPAELPVCTLENRPRALQIKKTDYHPQLPLETGDRSFVISDSLELPTGSRAMEQLYRLRCSLEVTDQKLVGTRAVFRGNARCRLLYLSQDHTLCTQEYQLPFSQYCDLQTDYDGDEQVCMVPVVTGYDLEQDQLESGKFWLNLHVLAQCVVTGKRHLTVMEDAYVTEGEFQPQWETFSLDGTLDQVQNTLTVRQPLSGSLPQVVDTELYVDIPAVNRREEGAVIEAAVSVHVLGTDPGGTLSCVTGKGSGSWTVPLTDTACCSVTAEAVGAPYVSSSGGTAEFRTELVCKALCTCRQTLRTLCGGTWEPPAGRGPAPSIILRPAAAGTLLWDAAKAAGAGEEALRLANGLEGDWVPSDRILLIPVG